MKWEVIIQEKKHFEITFIDPDSTIYHLGKMPEKQGLLRKIRKFVKKNRTFFYFTRTGFTSKIDEEIITFSRKKSVI